MKKLLLTLITLFTIVALSSCKVVKKEDSSGEFKHQRALQLYHGKFAFCGASPATLTGNKITIQGNTFLEGCGHSFDSLCIRICRKL
jgi:hypothetical protein